MFSDEKATAHVEPASEPSSQFVSRPQSFKSEEEAEDGIEETFVPAQDLETGYDQHGGDHKDIDDGNINLVDWDGPSDPNNPINWSRKRKWWISILTAFMTFVISFGSSVFSATTTVTAEKFGASSEVMILGVTLYVVGFACGPLVWGPLSEIYGRRSPLLVGYLGFVLFQIPVAVANDLQTIFICRFFAGVSYSNNEIHMSDR